jgi:DNA topoisomerase-1
MKTVEQVRDRASKTAGTLAGAGKKAAYAVVGASEMARKRIVKYSGKMRSTARKEFEAWVEEGERVTEQLREGKVVEDLKERVDFDHLQERVEKLRDQLEEVLANWRATFKPEKPTTKPKAKKTTAKKTASKATAKKATAKKPAADEEPETAAAV